MSPDLQSRVAGLSPEKRELLKKRLAARTRVAIPRRAPDDPTPVSFSQQRLWFLDQLEPGNPAYNVYRAVRLNGPLDAGALGRSLTELVRRHEVLRTSFRVEEGVPVQQIGPPAAVLLPICDLSGLPPPRREAEARRLIAEEVGRSFDLRADILLRALLFRLATEEHILALSSHHIAVDGWSVAILFRELGLLYGDLARKAAPTLPEPALQFADYAVWERRTVDAATLDRLAAYWIRQLDGMPPHLELRTDRPRPPVQSSRGARYYLQMSSLPLDEVRAFSRRNNATLFMTLLASFAVLLSRYSGQEDVALGSPMACREIPELETLIGCFSNTLVLRVRVARGISFRELLDQVRETVLGALAHQLMPFDRLVESLRPKRDPSRVPLVQVNFRLLNAPLPPPEAGGLRFEFLPVDNSHSKFDLALELFEAQHVLGGFLEYNTDLFHPETMPLIASDLEDVIKSVAMTPQVPLDSLDLMLRFGKRPAGLAPRNVRRLPIYLPGEREQAGLRQNGVAPEYTVRNATLADSGFIYELRRTTMQKYLAQVAGWTPAYQEAFCADFDPVQHQIVLVSGKPAGAMCVIERPAETYFANLHLLPWAQCGGLGTKIMRDVLLRAEARGVPLTGQVLKVNRPSQRMCERIGMRICGETPDRYLYSTRVELSPAESDRQPADITANRWFAYVRPRSSARMRLFCVPYAGGDAALFRSWQDSLPGTVEICPVLLPGHGARLAEPLLTDAHDVARALAEAICACAGKPFALFGHSTGALICFELARELRRKAGPQPTWLLVSGCGAPQRGPDRRERIHDLPESEFVDRLRGFGGLPEAALEDRDLRQLMLPILRADFQITENYGYTTEERLGCAVSVFGGSEDRHVTREGLEAWREQTSAAFKLQMLPGDHFFINSSRRLLLEAIASSLAESAA